MKAILTLILLLLTHCILAQAQCSDNLDLPDLPPWPVEDVLNPWLVSVDLDSTIVQGHAYVKYRCGAQVDSLNKPFIFVEGVDFESSASPTRCGDFGWEQFVSGDSPKYEMLYNLPILLDTLRTRGYDIILVDFRDGAGYVQHNSELLQQVIRKVHTYTMSKQPLVIAGASMGGQISRHALCTMEQNGEPHCGRLWVSLDSPHQGANIPIGLQEALHFLADPFLPNPESAQGTLETTLYRPAARQFLKLQLADAQSLQSEYVSMMDNLGYPQDLRTVGLANGAMDGTPLDLIPGSNFFDYEVVNAELGEVFAELRPAALPGNPQGLILRGLIPSSFEVPSPAFPCAQIPNQYLESFVVAPQIPYNLDRCAGGIRATALEMILEINATLTSGICPADTIQEFQPFHSFIPTSSALGLNDSLLESSLLQLLENSPQAIPFDFVHGPIGTNEFHSEISDQTLKLLLHQIFYGENALGPVLDLSSQNGGLFNFKDSARYVIYDLEIGAGGFLRVNAQVPAHFGELTSEITALTPEGSNFELRSNPCGADVIIQDNGQLRLGDSQHGNTATWFVGRNSSVVLEPGAKLTLEAGSKIIFGKGSRLQMNGGIIEAFQSAEILFEGGSDFVFNGGKLQFHDADSKLVVGGNLTIGPNATFTIDQFGNSSAPLIWRASAGAVEGLGSSVFRLKGFDTDDLTLRLEEDAVLKISPKLHSFQLKRGRIEMRPGSSIHSGCPFEVFHVSMIDESAESAGCIAEDQTFLQHSTFENILFEATLFDGMLKIWECDFNGDRSEVLVNHRGFDIRNSDFTGSAGVSSQHLNYLSRLSSCDFSTYGVTGDFVAFSDLSESDILIEGCTFGHSDTGVFKQGGELILRCNSFEGNDTGIHLATGTSVDMSGESNGGFNQFLENGTAFFLDGCELPNLIDGFNRFNQDGHLILFDGSLSGSCQNDCAFQLDCRGNTWSEAFENSEIGLAGPNPDADKISVWVLDNNALCLPDPPFSLGCPLEIFDEIPVDPTACQDENPKQVFGRNTTETTNQPPFALAFTAAGSVQSALEMDHIQLLNIHGQVVKEWRHTEPGQILLAADSASGVFLLRFQSDGQFHTQRFVKPN